LPSSASPRTSSCAYASGFEGEASPLGADEDEDEDDKEDEEKQGRGNADEENDEDENDGEEDERCGAEKRNQDAHELPHRVH
jgi:hypothetical protein